MVNKIIILGMLLNIAFFFIQGAVNIYTKEDMLSEFIEKPKKSLTGKKTILIFHCEFSSKRGPDMWVERIP